MSNRLLHGCMQPSSRGEFLLMVMCTMGEKSLNLWLQSSSFQIRLLQSWRRRLPLPAFMCMMFAWTRTPVMLLRFTWLILHGRVGLGTCQLSYWYNNQAFMSRDTLFLCKRKATAFANVMGLCTPPCDPPQRDVL
jgi:hypothetical protein